MMDTCGKFKTAEKVQRKCLAWGEYVREIATYCLQYAIRRCSSLETIPYLSIKVSKR
jgi:hypothetical protein